jgi:hypothetical protein
MIRRHRRRADEEEQRRLDSGSAQGLAEREALMATNPRHGCRNAISMNERDSDHHCEGGLRIRENADGDRFASIRLSAPRDGIRSSLVETAKPAAEKDY